jgi:FkbM family methyltransferase
MLPPAAWQAARASYQALSRVPGVERAKSLVAEVVGRTPWTAWAVLEDGTRLRVDLANIVGRSIWFRGTYDEPLVRFLMEPLQPGDAFLDVGANVGYYTARAARQVGPEGCVFAVEPGPSVARLLADSLTENAWQNVVLLTVAATERPGLLRFRSEANSGWSRVEAQGDHVVAGARLDDVIGPLLDGRPLRAVKIDVEGHELQALAGMKGLLGSCKPERILTEAHVSCGIEWLKELFGIFTELGYRSVDPLSRRPIGVSDVSSELWNVGFVL